MSENVRKMTLDEAIENARKVVNNCHQPLMTFETMNSIVKDNCREEHEQLAQWLEELKKYKELEEQGRLVKLPCKIGAEVYNTTWWDDVQEKVVIKGKTYYRTVHKHKVTKSTFSYFDIGEFGKTIFLTKEEAKANLKEMRCNND